MTSTQMAIGIVNPKQGPNTGSIPKMQPVQASHFHFSVIIATAPAATVRAQRNIKP